MFVGQPVWARHMLDIGLGTYIGYFICYPIESYEEIMNIPIL